MLVQFLIAYGNVAPVGAWTSPCIWIEGDGA